MSQIANVIAFDGAGTPASHTFVPVSVSKPKAGSLKAEWREVGLAVPTIAQPRLSMELERNGSGVYISKRTLEIPVMESVSGQNAAGYTAAPKVAHIVKDVRLQYAHERSDIATRRLTRQLGNNIDDGETTSQAVVTTGAAAEMFDQLVMPT